MTARSLSILIILAAALCGIASAHAQEVIAVAQAGDTGLAPEEALVIEGFTGGVGGTGPDASGGGAIVIQMLQQTSANTAIATSGASSRYVVRATAH